MPFLLWNSETSTFEWKIEWFKFPVFVVDCLQADYDQQRGICHELNYFRRRLRDWTIKGGKEAYTRMFDDH